MLRKPLKNVVAVAVFVLLFSISTVASVFAFYGQDTQCQFTFRDNGAVVATNGLQPPPPPPTSNYTIQQTLSDKAQQATIAFDAFAFLTGDLCSDSFLPPGELAGFFGFQYHRDNDQSAMGHSGEYLTRAGNNVLYILSDTQKAELVTLAKNQVSLINEYAYERFPLMKAFRRQLEGDLPNGSGGLNRTAVMEYSAELYRLDAAATLQRATVYARILRSLSQSQRDYLDGMAASGMLSWSQLGDQVDKKSLSHDEHVALMTYAADIFSWYAGSADADTYFAPERQAGYFGAFYLKDRPAMGNASYAIPTDLTGKSGEAFLAVLTDSQRGLVTGLVDLQRADLNEIVEKRHAIAVELRRLITEGSVDEGTVMSLMERYGELDGEISYYYATRFAEVARTLSSTQNEQLAAMRKNLNDIPCSGAYLYSQNIAMPEIENTDFLFGGAVAGVSTTSTATTAATTAETTVTETSTVISTTIASTIVTSATTATIEGLQMQVVSNSSVSGLIFDSTRGLINFTVSGPEGSQGFFDATIAKALLSGQPIVMIDGVEHRASVSEDASFWYFHVIYPHSEHHVTIGGSETVPEFPSFLVSAVVFMIVITLVRIRRQKNQYPRREPFQLH